MNDTTPAQATPGELYEAFMGAPAVAPDGLPDTWYQHFVTVDDAHAFLREARKVQVSTAGAPLTAPLERPIHDSGLRVSRAPVDWAWADVLERGTVALVEGPEAIGKSLFVNALAAAFTGRMNWPDGSVPEDGGRVSIWSPEGRSLGRRLDAAGADPALWGRWRTMPSSVDELVALELDQTLSDARPVRLIVIDPYSAVFALAGASENDAAAVARVFAALAALARDLDCVVLAVHHTGGYRRNKAADDRVRGSSVFRSAPRAVLSCEYDNADGTLVVAKTKVSEAPAVGGWRYRIEVLEGQDGAAPAVVDPQPIEGRGLDIIEAAMASTAPPTGGAPMTLAEQALDLIPRGARIARTDIVAQINGSESGVKAALDRLERGGMVKVEKDGRGRLFYRLA